MSAITDKKKRQLLELQTKLNITNSEFEEKVTKGSGKGGQKRNKTSNCIQIHHLPTGEKCQYQKSRSLEVNRFMAKRNLLLKIAKKKGVETKLNTKNEQKIKKQKNRRRRKTLKKINKKSD